MITRQEVTTSLYGAWRLFLRDPQGLRWFDTSISGFWKSFYCAALVLPAYAVFIALAPSVRSADAGFLAVVITMGSAYVIAWVAWPLVIAHLTPVIGREKQYLRYIVAYNWAAAPRTAIDITLIALRFMGILSEGLFTILSLVALLLILSYYWFIARLALDVTPLAAVGLVAADFILGYIIHATGIAILH